MSLAFGCHCHCQLDGIVIVIWMSLSLTFLGCPVVFVKVEVIFILYVRSSCLQFCQMSSESIVLSLCAANGLCLHFGDYMLPKGRVKMSLCQVAPPSKKYWLVFESIFVSCNRIITEYISDSLVLMCVFQHTETVDSGSVICMGTGRVTSVSYTSVRIKSEYLHIWCKF